MRARAEVVALHRRRAHERLAALIERYEASDELLPAAAQYASSWDPTITSGATSPRSWACSRAISGRCAPFWPSWASIPGRLHEEDLHRLAGFAHYAAREAGQVRRRERAPTVVTLFQLAEVTGVPRALFAEIVAGLNACGRGRRRSRHEDRER